MNIICKGRVNISAPGTPVALTTDPTIRASKLLFQAIPGSTGKTYVGVTGMTKATYSGVARTLASNASSGFSDTFYLEAQDGENSIRLIDYAIDADVAGEGVLVSYWQE
jgi:hypothetical protein